MSTNERWYIIHDSIRVRLMHLGGYKWDYLWYYGSGAGQPPVYATRNEALHALYAIIEQHDDDVVVDGATFDALVAMEKARAAMEET